MLSSSCVVRICSCRGGGGGGGRGGEKEGGERRRGRERKREEEGGAGEGGVCKAQGRYALPQMINYTEEVSSTLVVDLWLPPTPG